jgi:hypothetical protein
MKWNWKFWKNSQSLDEFPYPASKPYPSESAARRKVIPQKAIKRYYLPLNVLEETSKVFKKFADRNAESYAWWAGYISGEGRAQICTAIYPGVETSYGRVYLDREFLGEMHKKLIELDQILLVELHTHPPGAGGQNPTDAANAAVFRPGFITVVVPNFGGPIFYDPRESYVYSYEGEGEWRQLGVEEIQQMFFIEETVVEVNRP